MDDYSTITLEQSKNEWAIRLVTIMSPIIIQEFRKLLEVTIHICHQTGDGSKYLMAFQKALKKIPTWAQETIDENTRNMVDKSGCHYLEDLVACCHIIHLKVLTAIRVGQKQKKIDIDIPKLDKFVHKVYIYSARKVYQNMYLFDESAAPLQKQKNARVLEVLIQESVLAAIRESIPSEAIIKAYMSETVETDVSEEVTEVVEPVVTAPAAVVPVAPSVSVPPVAVDNTPPSSLVTFGETPDIKTYNLTQTEKKDKLTASSADPIDDKEVPLASVGYQPEDEDDAPLVSIQLGEELGQLGLDDAPPAMHPATSVAEMPTLDEFLALEDCEILS